MKQRVLTIIITLTLCLCMTAAPAAYALEETPPPQESSLSVENTTESDINNENVDNPEQLDSTLSADSPTGADISNDSVNVPEQQENTVLAENTTGTDIGSDSVDESDQQDDTVVADNIASREDVIPTPQQVYEAMIALKAQDRYKEGAPWTNETHSYTWKGGTAGGIASSGAGCVAFAYELSDAAFGSLPARMTSTVNFSDVKAGDILRVNNDAHTVIVIQVSSEGVVVAEGNYHEGGSGGLVHWGRSMTKAEVEAANHYITRYPVGYIPPDDPSANDPVEGGTGTFGENLNWTLTKSGTLTISGSGSMPDYSASSEQPWNSFSEQILKIVIEDGVTNIGDCAFWGIKTLSVNIPSSVESIGNNAFLESSIIAVNIPASVKTIGISAFKQCKNLGAVTVSEGVETISDNAFRGCTSLKSISLPASVNSVGAGAFVDCTELTKVTFAAGDKQVQLGDNLFTRCYKLTSVKLPENINAIGEGMFQNCLMLSSITIPQGAESIGGSAFASCGILTDVWIPDSVTQIGSAAFSACGRLKDIYFGGSENQWNTIQKIGDTATTLSQMTIHYGSPMPEPEHEHSWAAGWSSDSAYHWHECSAANCDITENSGKNGYGEHVYDNDTDDTCNTCGYTRTTGQPEQPGHEHIWADVWSSDSAYHWHECSAANCGITENSGKNGYEAHNYGEWAVDKSATAYQSGSRHRTCAVCGYNQTEVIPATGSSSSGGGGGSGSNSSSSTTNTTQNPDGSTTTTKTDNSTGTVTETTKKPDGSQIIVETKKDGTVTTKETDSIGNKTETVVRPDGSRTVTIEQKDGFTTIVNTDANGKMKTEVKLPGDVTSDAQQKGETVVLPIEEVQADKNSQEAPVITVNTGSNKPVKVEIPAVNPTPGTVAVIVHPDGTEETVKTSIPTEDSVLVSIPDGTTLKLFDNSIDFMDISSENWAADAIDFVSARELFTGTTAATFTPEALMTRAMLMTVLARFDGENTDGGSTWYEKGMDWAVANGISDGSSPDESISREQLVTMLWRYAGSPAVSTVSGVLSGFTDSEKITGFAQNAMNWAVENNIISGLGDGQIEPQGQATRAQVAQIMMNFIQK